MLRRICRRDGRLVNAGGIRLIFDASFDACRSVLPLHSLRDKLTLLKIPVKLIFNKPVAEAGSEREEVIGTGLRLNR